VGDVAAQGHAFAIYDLHDELAPPCPQCARHGGQRVIVLRDGRYLGQYKPEAIRATVRRHRLVLTPAPGEADTTPAILAFTAQGPPRRVLVNGEVITLFR
jgi:hypothetical protein